MRLLGKITIITGGATGIGRSIALAFAREEARVVVADLDHAKGAKVAKEITQANGTAEFHPADVSQPRDVTRLVDFLIERFGRIDILVNNAGIYREGDVVKTDEATWDSLMAVNLKSVFLCSREVIPYMQRQGGGVILNVSSSAGWIAAAARSAAYTASKFGVTGLTKAMAVDHAKDGIRINALCPGPTDTPMLRTARTEDRLQTLRDRLPMGRFGEPMEIATAAVYLCTDEAAFITGVAFPVDGGYTAKL